MALSTSHINSPQWGNPYTKPYFLSTFSNCIIDKLQRKKKLCFGTNVGHHDSKGSHWTAWHVQTGWLTFMKWTPLVEVLWIQHSHMTIGTFYRSLRTFYLLIKIQSVHFSLCMCLGLDINYLLSENSNDTNKNYDTVMQTINSLIWNTCLHFQNTISNFFKIS